MKFKILLFAVTCIFIAGYAQTSTLNSVQVTCDPPTVGAKQVQLTVQFFTELDIPTGSYLQVKVPSQASVVQGQIGCGMAGYNDQNGLACTGLNQTLEFQLNRVIKAFQQNVYLFYSAFNAPLTSDPTDSFVITILNVNKTQVIAQSVQNIQLPPLNPNVIKSVSIVQSTNSSTVVGALTSVVFTVTTLNPIPAGGGLQIQLPKWNTQAPDIQKISYINTTNSQPLCLAGNGMLNVTCSLYTASVTDTLLVKNMFPNGRLAGDTFTFTLQSILNPLSMSAVTLTVTTFSSILSEVGGQISFRGVIDQGPALLAAQQPAAIDPQSALINADVTTVYEYSQLIIPFKIPVPVQLDLGCTIQITLPDDFTVVAGKLTIFKGWGIFQGVADLNVQIDEQQRIIKIVDQCVKYTAANQLNTIRIGQIQNPQLVRPTKDFKIQILDKNGLLIAQVSSGVKYTPTPGTFNLISLIPHSATVEVQEVTDVQLVFTPAHPISSLGKLNIKFPNDLTAKCDIIATSGGINLPLICQLGSDGTITLANPFATTPYYGNQQLSITFRSLQLPNSQRPILGITLESYDQSNSVYYLVDQFSKSDYQFFTPNSVTFLASSIDPSPTTTTYTETQFRFSNTCATQIPVGSYMKIYVPSEITVQNAVSVMSSCKSNLNMSPNMTCSIVQNRDLITNQLDGSHTITINGAFNVQREKNDELLFTIQRGLVTPISTETSSSFKITIFDKNDFAINFVNSALTLTMQDGLQIGTIGVTPSSYIVGANSTHNITFETPVPFKAGFKLYIFVPNVIITPKATDIRCQGSQPLIQNLTCQINGNRVTVQLETISQVSVGQSVSIAIGQMTNQGSTLTSDPYQLEIRSATWYEVATVTNNPGGKVTMQQPASITNYNFTVFDYRQNAITTVTIDWVSTQTYPKDTKLVIDYNQNQIKPANSSQTTIPCIFRQSLPVVCQLSHNQISVQGFMQSEEYGNSQMELTITNMLINVQTPLTTDSWNLTTYLGDGLSKIDRIQSNMSLTFLCNYPCQTCLPGQPDVCTSCNTIDHDLILYLNKCYQTCPTGTFYEYFECKLCDPKCLTCAYTSGTSCTSCNPNSPYPFLNGKDCSPTCNYGEYGNSSTATCQSCRYPCEQCSINANNCTSCRQDSSEIFYFKNQCLPESCPDGYYVLPEARDNICLQCSQNCKTCSLTRDTCTSCPDGFILNLLDNTCVSQCPQDISVYQPQNSTSIATCQPCHPSCNTCKNNVMACTSCSSPLSLKTIQNVGSCVLECDVYNNTAVSIKNVCIGCSSSCKACQNTPDYCIKCVEGKYFYQNHCVDKCPKINEYQYEPIDGICTINGTICQFGYYRDEVTLECILKNQICQEYYELNKDKTACIPISTFYVPFPFIITIVLLSIVPIVSKVKFKTSLMVPMLIVLISFFESICLLVLVAQAKIYGIIPTFYLSIVGLIFMFAGNMFFMLMYVQQVKTDAAFKHWYPKHNRVANLAQLFGLLNFKMYRMLYCKFFGKEYFNAPFTEPTLFYRPFNLTSLFAIVTVTLPIIVSTIIGLIYVRWGYQLYITCIELLLIEITLVSLQVTEYCQQKFVQKKYFKVTKREVEVKVCSNFPDSEEEDEYGTKRERKSKPKSIKAVRHLGRVVAKMAGNADLMQDQVKQVDKEIQELHVEDMMNRQLRHCQSFKIFRPTLEEQFSGSEGESDKFQDFISEPASPRSKEMLLNSKFIGRMHFLHDVYKMRDEFDNCYHQPVDHLPNVLLKPIDRKVQTNVLELLGIDDVKMSTEEEQESESEKEIQLQEYSSKQNRRKRLSKKRIMEVPDFEFDDIQGDFEADEFGHFLLVKKQGRLHDKKGRLVNRRGYLIDQIGNVITRLGKVIFYVDELSPQDDELPDPFCYEKVKQLKTTKNEVQFRVTNHQQILDQNLVNFVSNKVEIEEPQVLQPKLSEKQISVHSDSQSSISERDKAQETQVKEEEDRFIQQLTMPKQPKSKQQLLSYQQRQAQSHSSDINSLAKVENEEQEENQQLLFKAMRPPSQASVHRVEQLQDMIQMKDLQFSNRRAVQNKKVKSGPAIPKYVPGQDISQAYLLNEQKLFNQQQKVLLDQEFLGKMESFNRQLNSKRKDFLNSSSGGRFLNSDSVGDGSHLESRGLAHRNLNNVYGRVKQKFNQNMGVIRETTGPSAAIIRKVDSRMQELEDIYMHPRIDGRDQKHRGQELNQAIESLDISKQLKDLHHLKSVSMVRSQLSAQDAKSQNQMRERPSMN